MSIGFKTILNYLSLWFQVETYDHMMIKLGRNITKTCTQEFKRNKNYSSKAVPYCVKNTGIRKNIT